MIKCPECGGKTSRYCAEVYVCHDRKKCKYIDAQSLYRLLRDIGISEEIIGKVHSNIVAIVM